MANPAVTHLAAGDATDTNNNTNITSGSVSPTGDALLCVAYAGNGGHTISSFSTTLSTSGSWYGPYTVDQGTQTVAIGFIKLASTPGTGTVSATLSSKTNRKAICLAEATGYDTTTPLLNTTSNTATGSSTTPSVTLTAVDAGNTTFGGVCAANSPTPDQGSELTEVGGAAGIPYLSAAYDDTSPGNTFSWTMTTGAWAVAAIEIKAAPQPDLTKSFTDDLDAWNDNADILLAHEIAKSDTNAANWSDSSLSVSFSYEIGASELSVWLHDRIATDDTRNPDYTFSDILNNWDDSATVVISYEIEKSDDLDSWLDAESHNLADAGGSALTKAFADSLNNWNDEIALLFTYAVEKSDDLDNWNDSFARDFSYLLAKSDDLANWNDSIDLGREFAITDDLSNWLDNVLAYRSPALQFADNIRAPPFPDPADDASLLLSLLIQKTDALSFSDSIDRVLGLHLSFADDLDNWLDNFAKFLGEVSPSLEETAGDTLTFSDARKILLGCWKRPADTLALTDGYTKFSALSPAFTDAMSLTDSAARSLQQLLSFANALTFSDARSLRLGLLPQFADTLALTDSQFKASDLFKDFTDSLTLTDASLRVLGYLINRSDDLDSWLDAVSKTLGEVTPGLEESHGDSLTLTDALELLLAYRLQFANSVTLADGYDKSFALFSAFTDTLTLSDNQLRILGYLSDFSDTLSLSDAYKREFLYRLIRADQFTLTDSAFIVPSLGLAFDDTLAFSDSHKRLLTYLLARTDQLTLTDGISRFYPLISSFADTMALSDADREILGKLLSFTDSMIFTDSHFKLLQMLMAYTDSLTLSDYMARKRGVEDGEMPAFTSAQWPNQNYYIGPFKV